MYSCIVKTNICCRLSNKTIENDSELALATTSTFGSTSTHSRVGWLSNMGNHPVQTVLSSRLKYSCVRVRFKVEFKRANARIRSYIVNRNIKEYVIYQSGNCSIRKTPVVVKTHNTFHLRKHAKKVHLTPSLEPHGYEVLQFLGCLFLISNNLIDVKNVCAFSLWGFSLALLELSYVLIFA